jgi:hypothetical protein
MENEEVTDSKPGPLNYVLAGLSFIPMIGVLFGIVSIAWGLALKNAGGKRIAKIGAAGIMFTVAIYSCLFYFAFGVKGGTFDALRAKQAQDFLNSSVASVEFYKVQHGDYPDTLDTLKGSFPKESLQSIFLMDPRSPRSVKYFYYQRIDKDHYYLRGLAPDGKPFSPGALLPTVPGKLGLVLEPPRESNVAGTIK